MIVSGSIIGVIKGDASSSPKPYTIGVMKGDTGSDASGTSY